jgi:hypothetical protein
MKNNKLFLDGTCNNSTWRDKLISMLTCTYFNPIVPDWNNEAYQEELRQRQSCDYCLYVITPNMIGVYSIAEVVDDSNKRPEKTLFCILDTDINGEFNVSQMKSLLAVQNMVKNNGARVFSSLEDIAEFVNNN